MNIYARSFLALIFSSFLSTGQVYGSSKYIYPVIGAVQCVCMVFGPPANPIMYANEGNGNCYKVINERIFPFVEGVLKPLKNIYQEDKVMQKHIAHIESIRNQAINNQPISISKKDIPALAAVMTALSEKTANIAKHIVAGTSDPKVSPLKDALQRVFFNENFPKVDLKHVEYEFNCAHSVNLIAFLLARNFLFHAVFVNTCISAMRASGVFSKKFSMLTAFSLSALFEVGILKAWGKKVYRRLDMNWSLINAACAVYFACTNKEKRDILETESDTRKMFKDIIEPIRKIRSVFRAEN